MDNIYIFCQCFKKDQILNLIKLYLNEFELFYLQLSTPAIQSWIVYESIIPHQHLIEWNRCWSWSRLSIIPLDGFYCLPMQEKGEAINWMTPHLALKGPSCPFPNWLDNTNKTLQPEQLLSLSHPSSPLHFQLASSSVLPYQLSTANNKSMLEFKHNRHINSLFKLIPVYTVPGLCHILVFRPPHPLTRRAKQYCTSSPHGPSCAIRCLTSIPQDMASGCVEYC